MIEQTQHKEDASSGQPLQQIEEALNTWQGGSVRELGALYAALNEKIESMPAAARDEATQLLDENFTNVAAALVGLDEMWQLETIERWLQEATRDLCIEARERIAAEVTAHYEDALAAGVQQGLHARMAHVRAMDDLGPPNKAKWKYRLAYLTQYEADVLAKGDLCFEQRRGIWFVRFTLAGMVFVNVRYVLAVGFDSIDLTSLSMSLLVVYSLLSLEKPPRWLAKRFQRRENLLTFGLIYWSSIALIFVAAVFALAGASWVSAVALGVAALHVVLHASDYLLYRGRMKRTYGVSAKSP